ncbi:MAG: helix-turn-helix domain-containing protein [Spirochaetes bacterium]|nr:helix-turn-helix domain-containing protein [Spirochaetota bacterium]
MMIGHAIRRIRKQQMRTLDEIAAVCGFTKSLLSKIEKGHTSPPVATLTKIAKALGVSVAALMGDDGQASTIATPAASITSASYIATDKGYSFFTYAAGRNKKLMQPYLFTAKKGKVKPQALSHAGEEFIYMLEGTMKYRVGATEYTLTPGDSLYFDANEEHEITPVSAAVKYLAVFTEQSNIKK